MTARQGYNWEDPGYSDRLDNYFNLHRAWVEQTHREMIEQLEITIVSLEPADFEKLKEKILRFNRRLQWLQEAETDEMERLLKAAS